MTTDTFEAELRNSLKERAHCVDTGTCASVRGSEFQPRTHPPGLTAFVVGLALLAVAFGSYLAVGSAGPAHRNMVSPSGPTIRLASFAVRLPAGAHVVSAPASFARTCAPKAPLIPGTPETVTQAGGVFATIDGGCLITNLGPTAVPDTAQPVVVGTYIGYVDTNSTAGTLTLYVDVSTNHDLIFTATGTTLDADQLIVLAASGMPPCSADREDAAACAPGQ